VLFDLLVIDSLEAVFAPLVFSVSETQRLPRAVTTTGTSRVYSTSTTSLAGTTSIAITSTSSSSRDHPSEEGPPVKAARTEGGQRAVVTQPSAVPEGLASLDTSIPSGPIPTHIPTSMHIPMPIPMPSSATDSPAPLPMGAVNAAAAVWAEALGAQTATLIRALLACGHHTRGNLAPPVVGAVLVTSTSASLLGGLSSGAMRRQGSISLGIVGAGGGAEGADKGRDLYRCASSTLAGLTDIADVAMHLRAAVLPPEWPGGSEDHAHSSSSGTSGSSSSSSGSSSSGSSNGYIPYQGRFLGANALLLDASNSAIPGIRIACPVIIGEIIGVILLFMVS
jgi:hypothetical protein